MNREKQRDLVFSFLLALTPTVLVAAEGRSGDEIFAADNLVAWCIVPFDARQRTPAERAAMLQRLGIQKVAYDWREKHVPSFEEEILQYERHGLEFFAFWGWHDTMAPLIAKHRISPQIWRTNPSPSGETEREKIEAAANSMLPLAEKTRRLGLQLGLYNHGGWGGEPRNLVAVCKHLRDRYDAEHVGIVYNFHHGHAHVDDFAASLKLMQPYLLCLNLNGMADAESVAENPERNKILPIGAGKHERRMLRAILESDYSGPLGILDHRPELDAELSLRQNLDGLEKVRQQLEVASP